MALGGCFSCIKYLMFAFNFIFWLIGCAILGLGIWLRVDPTVGKYAAQSEALSSIYLSAYIFIAMGAIIMVIGFLGCCGAIRESQCMLAVFFGLLFIIFAVLLGFGIYCVVQRDLMKDEMAAILQSAVDNYYTDDASQTVVDEVQRVFECCGASQGSKDFSDPMKVPDTCLAEHRDTPCEKKLYAFLTTHFIVAAGVSIAVSFIMILGMIFSITLCCAIRDSNMA